MITRAPGTITREEIGERRGNGKRTGMEEGEKTIIFWGGLI